MPYKISGCVRRCSIISKISSLLDEFKGQAVNKWLKSYEVKKLLNISPGTLQHMRDSGQLPFTKIGGVMYYRLADIEQMLSGNRAANTTQPDQQHPRMGGRR